jgi:hypothetical protein
MAVVSLCNEPMATPAPTDKETFRAKSLVAETCGFTNCDL